MESQGKSAQDVPASVSAVEVSGLIWWWGIPHSLLLFLARAGVVLASHVEFLVVVRVNSKPDASALDVSAL